MARRVYQGKLLYVRVLEIAENEAEFNFINDWIKKEGNIEIKVCMPRLKVAKEFRLDLKKEDFSIMRLVKLRNKKSS